MAISDGDAEGLARLFHGIVEQSVAGIYLIQDGVLSYVNATYAELFGTVPERLVGRPLAEVAPLEQRESLLAQYDRRISGSDPHSRFQIRTKVRGSERIIEIHGSRVEYDGRPAVVGMGVDVTIREQATERLRALNEVVETIQDRERQRIAMELHDDLGGTLPAIKFDLSRLARIASADERGTELAGLAADTVALVQQAIDATRRISNDLSPTGLIHLGLAEALRELGRAHEARYGVPVTVRIGEVPDALDDTMTRDLFRMTQELLTNVARHAAATRVRVQLDRDGQQLRLRVSDDGRGLPDEPGEGFGLFGIAERARRNGGTFETSPAPGGGLLAEGRVSWPGE
ncbi:PAS domain-containing sensor histidine kinase [Blastococcus sp. Marseille-P5729]|uniref:PAS domain-containing sensor histidine kinase n=1 Tax=Blastococcus sp. Marseille-P5729 TaxID=2086582 RepID=UPI00131C2E64|nr:PAS domain-containing sensor histidine kinase [Blastococcus sp. Marseille-P5729]